MSFSPSAKFAAKGVVLARTRSERIVTETTFESLPLQLVTVPIPIAPETEVVLVPGGLNTNTGTMPGFVISPAIIVTFNW
jgi:hypothetical protein